MSSSPIRYTASIQCVQDTLSAKMESALVDGSPLYDVLATCGSLGGEIVDLLEHLLAHDRWATLSLLQASRDLSNSQLDQKFDIGQRTLRNTFWHLIHNIAFWSGLMAGRPLSGNPSEFPPDSSVDALIAWLEHTHTSFAVLALQLAQDRRLADTFVDHYGEKATFGGAILHNVLHSAEHRTEALHILRRLGVPNLEETDLLLWEYTVWRAQ